MDTIHKISLFTNFNQFTKKSTKWHGVEHAGDEDADAKSTVAEGSPASEFVEDRAPPTVINNSFVNKRDSCHNTAIADGGHSPSRDEERDP